MNSTSVNLWPWSLPPGYNQAEVIEDATRHLTCAGQTSVDETGAPQHLGDMRAQMGLYLANVQDVLAKTGMGLEDVTRIGVYSTDVDATLRIFVVIAAGFGQAGVAPPMTLLGVTRLTLEGLMIELEISAAR